MGAVASIEYKTGESSTTIPNYFLQTMENATTALEDWTEHSADGEKEVTNEEKMIEKEEKLFNTLNENINKIKLNSSLRAAGGNCNGNLIESLLAVYKIFFDFDKIDGLQYNNILKCRREAGQRLSESPTSIMCKVIMDGWQRGYINENGIIDVYQEILMSLGILQNYSDCTPEVTYDMAGEPDFLETIKQILTTLLPKHMKGETQEKDENFISGCLGIFHNISKIDQNIPRLRSLEIVPVLDSFLDAKKEMYHLAALATLANIIDEQESEILRDKPDVVIFLLETLKLAIQNDKRDDKGWSAHECAMAVRRIARNDANKKILVRLGCLQHLVELAETGNVEEQRVSSFEQKNRPVSAVKEPGKRSGATVKNKKGHIMINYYDVWVDTKNMNGSTLQAMASAVEAAHVVLICMSQKYKDSPNCRLEAEYAHKLNKNIIPLKMERRYEPDGWLGILIGTQLFYEFSGKYPFEAKLKDLLRGIQHCYENEDVKPRGVAVKSPLEKTVAVIREWTPERVNKWIEEQKLPKENFPEFTSRELALLVTMRSEAPEFVYNCLQKNLGITSLKTMAILIEGLEDLLSKDLQDLSA
ncbi:hypothetical protein ACJMK2_014869 [Sinanodonta woodiana]|uniref:TIR domain-containing protein n=1 Tax=Sinanodonta woodiana TaxID=1069815 RepID=A0ABD3V1X2_SINWO